VFVFKKKWDTCKEGAYAVVFFSEDGRATKVFKRSSEISGSHITSVFESEVMAYKVATAIPSLARLIPPFYGEVRVERIIDASGADITADFYVDRAYQMQRIMGAFVKLGSLPSNNSVEIRKLFFEHGIRHMSDASVTLDAGKEIECIIDFAIQEYEL